MDFDALLQTLESQAGLYAELVGAYQTTSAFGGTECSCSAT